jgi:1,4-alpha-glucan branching enzyme
MGEEFGASSPFLFFCDFGPELAQAVTQGRRREFARFGQFSSPEAQQRIPDPNDLETFERCRLDWQSIAQSPHAEWHALYRKLLALRREHIVPRLASMQGGAGRHTVVAQGAFVVTWLLGDGSALELRLNLSDRAAHASSAPAGTLLHCEPPAAARAFASGELPPNAAAVYADAKAS